MVRVLCVPTRKGSSSWGISTAHQSLPWGAVFSTLHSLPLHHSQVCAGCTTDRLCNGFEGSFLLLLIWINPSFLGLALVIVNYQIWLR